MIISLPGRSRPRDNFLSDRPRAADTSGAKYPKLGTRPQVMLLALPHFFSHFGPTQPARPGAHNSLRRFLPSLRTQERAPGALERVAPPFRTCWWRGHRMTCGKPPKRVSAACTCPGRVAAHHAAAPRQPPGSVVAGLRGGSSRVARDDLVRAVRTGHSRR